MDQRNRVGRDMSGKEITICLVDSRGKVAYNARVESDPEMIGQHMIDLTHISADVGLEVEPLPPRLYPGRVTPGLPVICDATRHLHAPSCYPQGRLTLPAAADHRLNG